MSVRVLAHILIPGKLKVSSFELCAFFQAAGRVESYFCASPLFFTKCMGAPVPCRACLVIHQNGRKTSTLGSIGVTSKVSHEKYFRCWSINSFMKYSPAPFTASASKFSRVCFVICLSTGIRNHFTVSMLINGTEQPMSRRTHTSSWVFSHRIFMRIMGLVPLKGFLAGLPPSLFGFTEAGHFMPYIIGRSRRCGIFHSFKNPPHCPSRGFGAPPPCF